MTTNGNYYHIYVKMQKILRFPRLQCGEYTLSFIAVSLICLYVFVCIAGVESFFLK